MFARFLGVGVGHTVQYDSSDIQKNCSEYLEGSYDCEDESDGSTSDSTDITMEYEQNGPPARDNDEDDLGDVEENDESEGSGIMEDFDDEDEESGSDSELELDASDDEDLYKF